MRAPLIGAENIHCSQIYRKKSRSSTNSETLQQQKCSAHILLPSSASILSLIHPPTWCFAEGFTSPLEQPLIVVFQCSSWTQKNLGTKKITIGGFLEKKNKTKQQSKEEKEALAKRNNLSSHEFPKSFVTNHVVWPHYFSLMSCHTWQKCDTDNTRGISVSIGSFPPVPSRKTRFPGCTVSAPWGGGVGKGGGGRDRVQRCCRLTNWNESGETFTKHPDSRVFYLWA